MKPNFERHPNTNPHPHPEYTQLLLHFYLGNSTVQCLGGTSVYLSQSPDCNTPPSTPQSSLLSVRGCQLLVLWLHLLLRQEGQRGSFPFPELLWGGAHLYPGGGAWTGGCAVAARAGRKLEREEQRGEAGWRAPRKPPGGQRVRASGREGARQRACDEERRGEERRAARGGHSGRRSRALLLERLGAAARRPLC